MKKSSQSISHHRINHSLTSPNLLNNVHNSNPASLSKLLCKTLANNNSGNNNNQICTMKFPKQNNRYNSNENCASIIPATTISLGNDVNRFPKRTAAIVKGNIPPSINIPDSNFDVRPPMTKYVRYHIA